MDKIITIVGPTASGKSDLAVYLAQKFNGEVISADSRQVYKGLDIGSGKITKKEMLDIPHHLLDVVDPKETFTVANYQKLAREVISEIIKRKKLLIIAGGSGFYIDSILYDQEFPEVPPNEKLRKELELLSIEELFSKLENQDPDRALNIDKDNKRRLVRALEIIEALGIVPKIENLKSNFKTLIIEIKISDEDLRNNINKRLLKRLDEGMIEEVQNLNQGGLSFEKLESFGLEYRYIAEYLQKKISQEEMIEQINTKSWQFAKRQKTWLKRYKNKKLVSSKEEALKLTTEFLT